jgi:uncharacterized protein YjbJ (UPF0337 family)
MHGSPVRRAPGARRQLNAAKEKPMGTKDKLKNAADEAKGKVKNKTGEATKNRDLEAKGETEETVAALKQAREKVKDAFKD